MSNNYFKMCDRDEHTWDYYQIIVTFFVRGYA